LRWGDSYANANPNLNANAHTNSNTNLDSDADSNANPDANAHPFLRACLKIPAVDLRGLQQTVSFGKMPVKAAISLRKATLLDLGGLAI